MFRPKMAVADSWIAALTLLGLAAGWVWRRQVMRQWMVRLGLLVGYHFPFSGIGGAIVGLAATGCVLFLAVLVETRAKSRSWFNPAVGRFGSGSSCSMS